MYPLPDVPKTRIWPLDWGLLVVFFAALHHALPVDPSVRRSNVTLYILYFFLCLASLLSGDLEYGSCQPTRNWGNSVSGLVFDVPHMYPKLRGVNLKSTRYIQDLHSLIMKGYISKQVAQGQYVVSNTRCLALHDCEL